MYLAGILAFLIFTGSCYFWFRRSKYGKAVGGEKLASWSESWLDFAIVLWLAFIVMLALLMGGERVITLNRHLSFSSDPNVEVNWVTIIYGMTIQLSLIVTVLVVKSHYHVRYLPRLPVGRPFLRGAEKLIRYLPFIWIAAGISNWLLDKIGISSGEQETITMMTSLEDPWKYSVCVITAVILAPILEELFFRGILFRFLQGKIPAQPALLISAALFSMLHFNTDSLVPIFILGYLLGSVYRETGDIRSAIGMHALFNGFSILLMSIDKWLGSAA